MLGRLFKQHFITSDIPGQNERNIKALASTGKLQYQQ